MEKTIQTLFSLKKEQKALLIILYNMVLMKAEYHTRIMEDLDQYDLVIHQKTNKKIEE